jgi:hypothetical protein
LKRRSGLPKRSTRQSKSEHGVVNERNVCSQERDKGLFDVARQRQQALFGERAHTAALNRRLAANRARDGEAQLAHHPFVPAVVGEARDKRRRVTLTWSPLTSNQPLPVVAQLGVDVGRSRSSTANPRSAATVARASA